MDKDYVHGLNSIDKFYDLQAIGMGSKANILDRESGLDLFSIITHAPNGVALLQIASHTALGTITCNDYSVLLIMAPSLEQRPRLPVLKHAGSAHNHQRSIFELFDAFFRAEVVNMFILEGITSLLEETLPNFRGKHIDVLFVDLLTFLDQLDGVEYFYVLKLLEILIPILVQNE
jgi:hypothetical protein